MVHCREIAEPEWDFEVGECVCGGGVHRERYRYCKSLTSGFLSFIRDGDGDGDDDLDLSVASSGNFAAR